jgi:hypothetical protein
MPQLDGDTLVVRQLRQQSRKFLELLVLEGLLARRGLIGGFWLVHCRIPRCTIFPIWNLMDRAFQVMPKTPRKSAKKEQNSQARLGQGTSRFLVACSFVKSRWVAAACRQ